MTYEAKFVILTYDVGIFFYIGKIMILILPKASKRFDFEEID